jgi:hypothetical protein
MSLPLIAAICDQTPMLRARGLGPSDLWLLVRLANRMNHLNGRCDPGYDQLVEDSGLSKGQIPKSLKKLKRAGVIDWQERWKPNSKQRNTNLYRIYHCADPQDPKKVLLQPIDRRSGVRKGVSPSSVPPVSPGHVGCTTEAGTGVSPGSVPPDEVYHQGMYGVSPGHVPCTTEAGTGTCPSSRKPGTNQEQNRNETGRTDQIRAAQSIHDQDNVSQETKAEESEADPERVKEEASGTTFANANSAPEGLTSEPVIPPTHPVAVRFLELVGSTPKLARKGPQWDRIAIQLQEQNPKQDINALLDWVWSDKDQFWRVQFMERRSDPFVHFFDKFGTILDQFLRRTKATTKKESNNGTPAPTLQHFR